MYFKIGDPIQSDISQFLKTFSPSTASKIMEKKVREAMQDSLNYMLRTIRFLTPFRTGDLRRSETIAPVTRIENVIRGEIFSDIHYAQYVEPWARMFYRGSDVAIAEVEKIFNTKVGEGVEILNGMGQKKGKQPRLIGTGNEWFR